ncbi:MAG TPA: TrkA family potassium uptake protein [Gaiellales bacterium]|jgi:trk system potassium uptake protein TrkA|nr:TrkA family potassium uptake protein [Gaiellales bacterium]
MKLLIVGCGRVGSAVAKGMAADGHEVMVVDEDPEALGRLPEDWEGRFIQGHALDLDVLIEAGIETADAAVIATTGDNTNIVVAQVAQNRFGCPCVVARVLDPARAAFYASLGVRTVCATSAAIETTTRAICAGPGRAAQAAR